MSKLMFRPAGFAGVHAAFALPYALVGAFFGARAAIIVAAGVVGCSVVVFAALAHLGVRAQRSTGRVDVSPHRGELIFEVAASAGVTVDCIAVRGAGAAGKSPAGWTATGRRRGMLLFTDEVHQMSDRDVAAISAHEFGHAKWRFKLGAVMLSRVTRLGVVVIFAAQPVILVPVSVVAYFAVSAFVAAVSRRIERCCDEFAVSLVGSEAYASLMVSLAVRHDGAVPDSRFARLLRSHPDGPSRVRAALDANHPGVVEFSFDDRLTPRARQMLREQPQVVETDEYGRYCTLDGRRPAVQSAV